MAVINIPNTASEQPTQNQNINETGVRRFQRSFKDEYSTLKTLADSSNVGDTLGGQYVTGINLTRCPGNYGILTFSMTVDDTQQQTQTAMKAVWSCKSVRNDMSILAYCGGSASRTSLELWMKETDADVADANKFHKDDYNKENLNSQEIAIANKIRKGIDSVIRFYPVLCCTSYWRRIPSSFMEDLGYIDNPSAPSADETHAPSNLSSIISAHSWLKVQDDVTETGDGRYQRVESWMGIPSSDVSTGWDADLYGTSRWTMPLGTTSNQ